MSRFAKANEMTLEYLVESAIIPKSLVFLLLACKFCLLGNSCLCFRCLPSFM